MTVTVTAPAEAENCPFEPDPQSSPVGTGRGRTAREWFVQNETPRPIWLKHNGRELILTPLESRLWKAEPPGSGRAQPEDIHEAFPQLRRLVDRRQVAVCDKPRTADVDAPVASSIRVAVIVVLVWLVSLWPLPMWWWLRIGAALGIALVLWFFVMLSRPARRERKRSASQTGGTVRLVRRKAWYNFTMAMVVATGILIPALTLYLATDLRNVVSFWPDGFAIDTSKPLVLVGRLMQLTFIAVVALMPALMYFQFDAERLSTLRQRWIQNVFRLDPTVYTLSDVRAKYDRQLEEAYGVDSGRGRLTRGRRSPIIVATLILAFGWLLIMLRAGDEIQVGPGDSLSFLVLLSPDQSLVAFAFLGAYFFSLRLVWQGFVRSDLRPKTYTTIAVRVLVVVILAWLIEAVSNAADNSQPLFLIAFTAGFVPDTILHLIWEKTLRQKASVLNLDQQQPLTEIEGIDLYERTRLSEEGITNVEALAHHDLIDLFFKTRFPAARLVDWVDQAILVMYLDGSAGESDSPKRCNAELRVALRTVGIRTASDLVEFSRRGDGEGSELCIRRVTSLSKTLAPLLPGAERRGLIQRLHVLSEALDHSEWLGRIENWRRSDLIEADPAQRRWIDESGDLRRGDPRVTSAPSPAAGMNVQPRTERTEFLNRAHPSSRTGQPTP
ncbi:hypothetical protein ACIA5D_28860 [Actinoplanes sp. NPDC051513]|uniref:hypothetical protein n=1 Tax=Actinoplanes sp. NPDC051513 TaxID=3363908 RepID=UPI0037AFF350